MKVSGSEPQVDVRHMSPVLRLAACARRVLSDRWVLGLYGNPRLAGLLRSTLNVFAPPGVQIVEVAGGPLRGVRLELNLKLEKYFWLGTYEPWVQEAIARYLRGGDWAWDVGAFIGYHTLFMWRLGAKVVAFEPDPANFDRLSRDLRLNGALDVKTLRTAVGRAAGCARLLHLEGHPAQTRVANGQGSECRVVSLDGVLADLPAPRLVKVDVEGAELDVLAGATRLVREVKPVWIVEPHGTAGEVIDCFANCGYRIIPIGKGVEVDPQLPVDGPAHLLAVP